MLILSSLRTSLRRLRIRLLMSVRVLTIVRLRLIMLLRCLLVVRLSVVAFLRRVPRLSM